MNRGTPRRRDLTPLEQLSGELDLHDLLFDKDTRKAFEAWGEKVKPLIAELAEVAGRVGKAKDIERLYGEATTDREAAAKALENANAEAGRIKDAATTNAAGRKKRLDTREKAIGQRDETRKTELDDREAGIAERDRVQGGLLDDRAAVLDNRDEEAKRYGAELDARDAAVGPLEEEAKALKEKYEKLLGEHRAFIARAEEG